MEKLPTEISYIIQAKIEGKIPLNATEKVNNPNQNPTQRTGFEKELLLNDIPVLYRERIYFNNNMVNIK
jgi:LEA14-like dessication related protein